MSLPTKPRAVDLTVGFDVIERLSQGQTLEQIEADPTMPSKGTFLLWLSRDTTLALAFDAARKVSAYALEDEALATARRAAAAPGSPAAQRAVDTLLQQLRWAAEKRNPQVFSRQAAVTVQVPIQINTSLDLGDSQGQQGTSQFPNIYEMQAENVREVDVSGVSDAAIEAFTRGDGESDRGETGRARTEEETETQVHAGADGKVPRKARGPSKPRGRPRKAARPMETLQADLARSEQGGVQRVHAPIETEVAP